MQYLNNVIYDFGFSFQLNIIKKINFGASSAENKQQHSS